MIKEVANVAHLLNIYLQFAEGLLQEVVLVNETLHVVNEVLKGQSELVIGVELIGGSTGVVANAVRQTG